MPLSLIVADSRPGVLRVWRRVVGPTPGISFRQATAEEFRTSPGLDALVLPAVLVHERFGGTLTLGQSQVVATRGEYHLPPWVVTTPAFEGEVHTKPYPDGTLGTEIEMTDNWSTSAEWKIIFREVLQAVARFNQEARRIAALGVHLELLDAATSDAVDEATGAMRAWKDHAP